MKKIIFTLLVSALAAPVCAEVQIKCEQIAGTHEVVVSFDATSEVGRVRVFALDITAGADATISEVKCLSDDYDRYPGSVQIDPNGEVIVDLNCLCDATYPGTLGAEPNGVTVEMGSMYTQAQTPPARSGDLVSLMVNATERTWISIAENQVRHGVVMEDLSVVDVDSGCWYDPVPPVWEPSECAGQADGDATCDGCINFADLAALKASMFKCKGQPGYNCCADFNHDACVDFTDLGILKPNFFNCGYSPSTGNQNCEP